MAERILEVVDRGASLCLQNHLLVLKLQSGETVQIPIAELGCVVLGISAVSISGALLSALSSEGIPVVISDDKRMPSGMMLPLATHYCQSESFRYQSEATLPLRKRLWQTVVQAKLTAQARTLKDLKGDDDGLEHLVRLVKSGDSENVEARGAICYWRCLFGSGFRRDRNACDNNVLLNYGYAALRAMTARALCCAGLHPTLGIHHHNRYDAFCLADDMMEPYRPVVDRAVYAINSHNDWCNCPSRDERHALLAALQGHLTYVGEQRTLFDLLTIHARQLVASFIQNKDLLVFA